MNIALWIIQILVSATFSLRGWNEVGSAARCVDEDGVAEPIPLPGLLIRFIGVCEVLGALGLILPGLLRIRPGLTPLAAVGLVIIMIGATAFTAAGDGFAMALPPLVVGVLAAFVAYGRWRLAPLPDVVHHK